MGGAVLWLTPLNDAHDPKSPVRDARPNDVSPTINPVILGRYSHQDKSANSYCCVSWSVHHRDKQLALISRKASRSGWIVDSTPPLGCNNTPLGLSGIHSLCMYERGREGVRGGEAHLSS